MRSFVRDATGGVRAERAVPGKPIAFHGGERADDDDVVGAVAEEGGNAVGTLRNLRQNVKDNNTPEISWVYLLCNVYKLTGTQARPLRRTCEPCRAVLCVPAEPKTAEPFGRSSHVRRLREVLRRP